MAAFDESCFGKVYGHLTIIGRGDKVKIGTMVICRCSCGKIKQIRVQNLRSGVTRSCGCKKNERGRRFKHGLMKHPLYNVWNSMKKRCLNKNDRAYKDYGGRGVTICEEWNIDFLSFYNWAIGNGWEKGLELDKDKLSPNGSGVIYSPEFCCFLTPKENGRHKRNNVIIEYGNEAKCISEWCEVLNISKSSIYTISRSGNISLQEAFDKFLTKKANKLQNQI